MHVGPGAARKTFKEIVDQLGLQVAHQAAAHLRLHHGGGASTEINRRKSKSFIHGHQKITGAHDAAFVSQRVVKRFPQSNAYVFNRVMLVNVQIALCFQFQIKRSMAGKKLQHVVKEPDSCGNLIFSPALDHQRELDVCFRGGAVQCGLSHEVACRTADFSSTISLSAATTLSISCCVPMLMRMHPSQSGRLRSAMPFSLML